MMSRRKKIIIVVLIVLVISAIVIWRAATLAKGDEGEKVEVEVTVTTAQIVRANLQQVIIAYGVVEAEPAGVHGAPAGSRIASPTAGVLAQVYCQEGQPVHQGDLLFKLDSRMADLAIEKAKQALVFAEFTYERQKKLLAVEGTAQKNVEDAELQLKTARNDVANATMQQKLLQIASPLAGVVTQISVRPGESVEAATVLAEVVNLERLVVTASVPAKEAAELKVGQLVEPDISQTVPFPTDPHMAGGDGKLMYVGSAIDPKSDTVTVRAMLPKSNKLLPGQYMRVRIICATHGNCLAVPEAALVRNEDGDVAIMLVENEHALQKIVQIGLRDAGLVEVAAEGLKEGQTVIIDGAYGLPDKTKIVIANRAAPAATESGKKKTPDTNLETSK